MIKKTIKNNFYHVFGDLMKRTDTKAIFQKSLKYSHLLNSIHSKFFFTLFYYYFRLYLELFQIFTLAENMLSEEEIVREI